MKLDVGQVGAVAVEGLQGLQRRRRVARQAQVQAVQVHRVRQASSSIAVASAVRICAGRHAEVLDRVVERGDVAAPLLPALDAAGIDHLHP